MGRAAPGLRGLGGAAGFAGTRGPRRETGGGPGSAFHRVSARGAVARQSGTQAVTVISTSSSGALSDATVTVVRAGLSVGKYLAYSSL